MLGMPDAERGPLRGWSLAILGALEPVLTPEQFTRGVSAVDEFKAYLRDLVARRQREAVARRRRNPVEADRRQRICTGSSAGDRLTELELLHNCIFILNAGHETTTNLIGNGVDLLLRHPDARADLRANPELIETAVEEFLRMESSNQLGNRRAAATPRSAASPCRKAPTFTSASALPTATRRSFPIPIGSTSAAIPTGISPSAPASTPVPACRLRAWRPKSQSAGCSPLPHVRRRRAARGGRARFRGFFSYQ